MSEIDDTIDLAKRLGDLAEPLRQESEYQPRPYISFAEIDELCRKAKEEDQS